MGSIGAPEILVVLLIALIFLGPERLPGAAKSLGKAVGDFRRVTGGIQAEVRDAVDGMVNPSKPDPEPTTTSAAPTTVTVEHRPGHEDQPADASATAVALPGIDADWSGATFPETAAGPVDPSLN